MPKSDSDCNENDLAHNVPFGVHLLWAYRFPPFSLPTPESHCKSLESLHPRRHITEFAGPHKHTFWSLVLINCVMLLSNSLCLMTVDAGFWASEWKTCLGASVHRGPGWSPGLQTPPSPSPPVALQGLPFKNAVCPSLCGPNCMSPNLQGMEELASSEKRLFSICKVVACRLSSGLGEESVFDLFSSLRNVSFPRLFFSLPFLFSFLPFVWKNPLLALKGIPRVLLSVLVCMCIWKMQSPAGFNWTTVSGYDGVNNLELCY